MMLLRQIRKCSNIDSRTAKTFTIVMTIGCFAILALIDSITVREVPITLLTFAFFIGSAAAWGISSLSGAEKEA